MKRILLTLLAVLTALTLFAGCQAEEPVPSATPTPTQEATATPEPQATGEDPQEEEYQPPANISPTTGLMGTTTIYKPVIVQIENEYDARPQEGLQQADVVYETMIEGWDTRFTCIFNDILYKPDAPEVVEVGPVRSSRYYHQWIQGEWDALYVHVGGAETPGLESFIWGPSADHIKQRINAAGMNRAHEDLIYRRRNTGKKADHTAYTDVQKDVLVYEYEPTPRQPFKYYPLENYADAPQIEKIEMEWWYPRGPMDFVEYQYDAEKDKLIRYMLDVPFITEETNAPVEVQNLIVQYCSVSDFPNEGGRKQINVFGEGPAEFIIHGKHLKGNWSRADEANAPTIYTLENGEEVTLTPGNTWIEIYPNNKQVAVYYEDGTEFIQNKKA